MIKKNLNLGLFILRLGLGIIFMIHGYPKITGGVKTWEHLGGTMSNIGINFVPEYWGFMAAFAEFGGGIFLLLGLFFTPSCLLLLATMAMATVLHVTKSEDFYHPLTLALVFLGLAFTGPGAWSLGFGSKSKAVSSREQTGKIKRILRNKGFGFITDIDGKQIFFHQTGIVKGRFDGMKEGQLVKFSIKQTPKGPNAVNIRIAQ